MRKFVIAALLLIISRAQAQNEPTVRIGLTQNAQTVSLRSATAFNIEQNRTRTAKFTMVVALDPSASGAITKANLQYRTLVELDGGKLIALPKNGRVRIDPPGDTPIEFDNHTYRGVIEVFGNSRNTLTDVNELPLEQYLLGVVPNELSPSTFGQIEALKAQAVAARTYAVKNLGQYRREGYDICDTDACQVYMGAGTEDQLSSRAAEETRGVIATYNNQPINALYSSTCGGRTESSENIFGEKVPYLVSVVCEYKHPEPKA